MLLKRLVLLIILLVMATGISSDSTNRESSVFDINNELEQLEEQYEVGFDSVTPPNGGEEDSAIQDEGEFTDDELPVNEDGDVIFKPSSLFYKDSPLSVTASQEFEMLNTLSSPVIVYAIRSSNRQFHSLLTKHQEIQPGKKLVMKIIYLPYQVEAVSAELTIVTSQGEYTFPISGNSVLNPYRVNPQLGVRFPAGATMVEKPIVMFNPHMETLFITEVFTSEPFLSLKGAAFQRDKHGAIRPPSDQDNRPTGKLWDTLAEAGKKAHQHTPEEIELLWTIPPGAEKEIITLSAATDMKPGRHEGFLHIKTNFDNIVMPVELQILTTLVYPQQEELFFGTLTSPEDHLTHDLWMNNNGVSHVMVTEIIPVEPDPNLVVELVPFPIIFAGDKISSRVARLTYSGTHPGAVSNRLLIITNDTNAASAVVDVRYSANVMHGGLRFEQMQTVFLLDIYNQTYPAACLHCDQHGRTRGFDPTLTPTLLEEFYSSGAHAQNSTTPDDASVAVSPGVSPPMAERPEHVLLRELTLTNFFDAPVVLEDVRFFTCRDILSTTFKRAEMSEILDPARNRGIVVHRLQTWAPVGLLLKKSLVYALYRENSDYLPRTCELDIITNVSKHRVSVYVMSFVLSIEHMDMVSGKRKVQSKMLCFLLLRFVFVYFLLY